MTEDLPSDPEIRAVWRTDAPPDQGWHCQRCKYHSTLGGNAAHHSLRTGHGLPKLGPLPPPPPPPLRGVRMGDAMRLMDDLHLAMEIADAALKLAEISGAHPTSLTLLRGLHNRLQTGVNERRDSAIT